MARTIKGKGWHKEPRRHSLARKGIKTTVQGKPLSRAQQYQQKTILPLSEQRKNYEREIINAIDWEGYDLEKKPTTPKEKLQFLKNTFKSEYGYAIERKGERKAFEEWLRGLPSSYNIPFYNEDIIKFAKKNGSLAQNATEKQEEQVINNHFTYMTHHTFRAFDKHGVK